MPARRRRIVGLLALGSTVLALAAAAAPAQALRSCGFTAGIAVRANSNTSCPFARNIAASFSNGISNGSIDPLGDSRASGTVYSPVTGQRYYMRCVHLSGYSSSARWGCYGGNSAYAQLTWYS